jgi:hypothetical protein
MFLRTNFSSRRRIGAKGVTMDWVVAIRQVQQGWVTLSENVEQGGQNCYNDRPVHSEQGGHPPAGQDNRFLAPC